MSDVAWALAGFAGGAILGTASVIVAVALRSSRRSALAREPWERLRD